MKRVREIEALLKEHTPEVDYDVEAGLERLREGGAVPAWASQVPRPRRVWWPWIAGVVVVLGALIWRPPAAEHGAARAIGKPVVTALPQPIVRPLPTREEAPVEVAKFEAINVDATKVEEPMAPVRKARKRAPAEVAREQVEEPVVVEERAVEPPPPASAAPTAQDPQDLVEMRQVAQAERALARDPARALALVRAGEQEYPRGYFHEERRYLEVVALAKLGRRDQARAAAHAFFQEFPRSSYRRRIEEAL